MARRPHNGYSRPLPGMRIKTRWFGPLGLLALLGSCYPMSTLQEPQTLKPGKVRVTVQARAGGSVKEPWTPVLPDLSLRVGVHDRLEVQAGGTPIAGRFGLKALLVDWESLMVAIVPTYQAAQVYEDADDALDEQFLPHYVVQTAIVPVIAGIHVSTHADVLLGADVHAGRRKVTSSRWNESGPVLAFGAHVGMALHLPGGHATFVPQCGVLVGTLGNSTHLVIDGGYDHVDLDDLRRGDVRWECALGVGFGARYAP
jgi:hypothetical protein